MLPRNPSSLTDQELIECAAIAWQKLIYTPISITNLGITTVRKGNTGDEKTDFVLSVAKPSNPFIPEHIGKIHRLKKSIQLALVAKRQDCIYNRPYDNQLSLESDYHPQGILAEACINAELVDLDTHPRKTTVAINFNEKTISQKVGYGAKYVDLTICDVSAADDLKTLDVIAEQSKFKNEIEAKISQFPAHFKAEIRIHITTTLTGLGFRLHSLKNEAPMILDYAKVLAPDETQILPADMVESIKQHSMLQINNYILAPLKEKIAQLEEELKPTTYLGLFTFPTASDRNLKTTKKTFLENFLQELETNPNKNVEESFKHVVRNFQDSYADVIAGNLRHETYDLLKKYVREELILNPFMERKIQFAL